MEINTSCYEVDVDCCYQTHDNLCRCGLVATSGSERTRKTIGTYPKTKNDTNVCTWNYYRCNAYNNLHKARGNVSLLSYAVELSVDTDMCRTHWQLKASVPNSLMKSDRIQQRCIFDTNYVVQIPTAKDWENHNTELTDDIIYSLTDLKISIQKELKQVFTYKCKKRYLPIHLDNTRRCFRLNYSLY